MNTTNDEQMRAAFEAWAQPQGYRMCIRDAYPSSTRYMQYVDDVTQAVWESWKAALTSQPVAGEPVAMPDLTDRQVVSACFSYRHDYGLMDSKARGNLEFQCREWWRAICKELEVPSKHPMVLRATAQTPASVVQEARQWWDWQGICDAYESGVGHGRQRRTLSNPHIEGSDGFHAYAYGVEQGNLQQDRADASKADVCTWTSGDEPCAACPQRVTALHMCRLLQDAALPADGGVTGVYHTAMKAIKDQSAVDMNHADLIELDFNVARACGRAAEIRDGYCHVQLYPDECAGQFRLLIRPSIDPALALKLLRLHQLSIVSSPSGYACGWTPSDWVAGETPEIAISKAVVALKARGA